MNRIMVIGRERSGTKWLTNLIANHPQIACVQSSVHGGVLETNLLDKMEKLFGSLAIEENRIGFNLCMKETAFFKLTGLPGSFIDESDCHDSVDFFVKMMDQYATNNNCTGWVQKTNSLLAEKVRARIPNVRIIVMAREPIANLVSTSRTSHIDFKYLNVGRMMAGYIYAMKFEDKFCKKHDIPKIKFENLKSDRVETMRSVFDILGYNADESNLADQFEKNTSFRTKKRPELNPSQRKKLQRIFTVLSLMPFSILKIIRDKFGHGRNVPARFVSGTFDCDKNGAI